MKARMEGEQPSLAELVEFCNGDEGAAVWMAQRWGRLHPADACMDTAYALTFYHDMQRNIDELRKDFVEGNNEALFAALELVAWLGIPMPEWTRAPFMQGWRRYRDVVPDDPDAPNVSTLGGAFGITRPDNFNAPAARFWGGSASLVWQLVTQRLEAGEALNAAFAAVAHELSEPGPNLRAYAMRWGLPVEDADKLMDARTQKGISAGTVKNVYYTYKRSIEGSEARYQRHNREQVTARFPDLSPRRKR